MGTGPRARELEAKARLGAGYASERSASAASVGADHEDGDKGGSKAAKRQRGGRGHKHSKTDPEDAPSDAEAAPLALNARQRRAARRGRWKRALEGGDLVWRLDADARAWPKATSGARGAVGAVCHVLLDRAAGGTALVPADGAR